MTTGTPGCGLPLRTLARHGSPDARAEVIVLTVCANAQLATGTSGRVLKHPAGEGLIRAIHEVMEILVYLTPLGYQALLTDGFDHASVKLPIVSRAMERGQRA
jgi:hypothetical protein